MKALLIQPPFVQLNAPYPAIHYLAAFLRSRDADVECFDHSIELYRRIFSKRSLRKVFQAAREKQEHNQPVQIAAEKGIGSKSADEYDVAQREMLRFFSYEKMYCDWIDGIIDFLSGSDPGMAHRLSAAVELPRGSRAQAFLHVRDGRIQPDEAFALATAILEDLGDFISYALDPEFGTVRYAERIASSRADFDTIVKALNSSWIMQQLYVPYLDEFWDRYVNNPPDLLLLSIPFPGCLLGALACAQSARAFFSDLGKIPTIIFGGGYVSTELRGMADTGIFHYCDYLSFDAGFGSLASILDNHGYGLYRTMRRNEAGSLAVCGFPADDSAFLSPAQNRITLTCSKEAEYRRLEQEAVATIFPDYRDVDFTRYLRIVDSLNPMHRLWSDTPWLKYNLTHGCYWRKCVFCDTELEYVADYSRSSIGSLLAAIDTSSARTGLKGIHFVDEAMPMSALLDFAIANSKRHYSFWGNVRFDATWTQARCEFLASRGLIAVSGGIEIATERGLQMTGKGFTLAELVKTLVAMRRAGLLIHTYLIYGFPDQPESDIIDSAEFCRQLFLSGLIDSAFWHRFVLTRHSRMYHEWLEHKRSDLKPIDRPYRFANNDLLFEGEQRFNRFDAPLAASLSAWMEGEALDAPLSRWFGKKAPSPSIAANFVETLISQAEIELDSAAPNPSGRTFWIAGEPVIQFVRVSPEPRHTPDSATSAHKSRKYSHVQENGTATALEIIDKVELVWAYRGGLERLALNRTTAQALCDLISGQDLANGSIRFSDFRSRLALSDASLDALLSAGLVVV